MFQIAEQQTDQQAPTLQAQDAQYYRRVLHDLIDIGADLARLVHQHARSQAEATQPAGDLCPQTNDNVQTIAPPLDPSVAFDRIARAVRRTIMLARKLNEPVTAQTEPDHRIAARKRIIRAVEDTIQRRTKAKDEAERLHGELLERLDQPDLDDDIATCPVDKIIEDICRDLGIAHMPGSHPWKRRTPADIALLAARAAMKTSPEAPASSAPQNAAPPNLVPKTVVPMRPGQPTVAASSTDPP